MCSQWTRCIDELNMKKKLGGLLGESWVKETNERRYIYNKTIKKRHNICLDFAWSWFPINSLKWAYKQPKARLVLPCPSSPLPPDSCYRLSDWQQLVNRAMTTFITETAMHNPDPEDGLEPDKVMPHRSVWFYRHLFTLTTLGCWGELDWDWNYKNCSIYLYGTPSIHLFSKLYCPM